MAPDKRVIAEYVAIYYVKWCAEGSYYAFIIHNIRGCEWELSFFAKWFALIMHDLLKYGIFIDLFMLNTEIREFLFLISLQSVKRGITEVVSLLLGY